MPEIADWQKTNQKLYDVVYISVDPGRRKLAALQDRSARKCYCMNMYFKSHLTQKPKSFN